MNCVEQSVPLGDKRRPGTLVPDEKKIGERELKEEGIGGGEEVRGLFSNLAI